LFRSGSRRVEPSFRHAEQGLAGSHSEEDEMMPMTENDVAHRLQCVLDGEKGFDHLGAPECDPVISDFQMPGISG
jgi:hypothetical protein